MTSSTPNTDPPAPDGASNTAPGGASHTAPNGASSAAPGGASADFRGPHPASSAAPDSAAPAAPFPDSVVQAILAAFQFLTRLPVTVPGPMGAELMGRAYGWFPLVGGAVGLLAGVVFVLAGLLGVPTLLAATAAVTVLVLVTGALHEDGLADAADGLCGGRDRAAKLEIMRDSRIGSYGTLALVLSIGLRVAALAALATAWPVFKALVVAGALSRGAMVATRHWQGPARTDGLSASLGGPSRGSTVLALALSVGIAVLFLGAKAILVVAAVAGVTMAMMRLTQQQVGGHTGDLLGATQQGVEVAVLILVVVLR